MCFPSSFSPQEIAFPKMVASCCRFLCYFCRISRQNQKAMFDHLSYLLENSSVGLGNTGPSHTNTMLQAHGTQRGHSEPLVVPEFVAVMIYMS